jgi:glycosyltransferase 2 family protein
MEITILVSREGVATAIDTPVLERITGARTLMLALLGMPLEAALSATILLRGVTFWLPMVPGVLIARRELSRM